MTPDANEVFVPYTGKIKGVKEFSGKGKLKYKKSKDGFTVSLPSIPDCDDYIIEVEI